MNIIHTLRVGITSLVLAFFVVNASAHYDSGYSHNADIDANASAASWMSIVPGVLRLSELSIPGTHDTMARYGGDSAQCQSMSLSKQLNSGIRYIDIRVKNRTNQFQVYHGSTYQHASFDDVLTDILNFLSTNNTETVLLKLKKEGASYNSTLSFTERFEAYVEEYEALGLEFYKGTDGNPRLEDMRNKVVILDGFSGSGSDEVTEYGIKNNNTVNFDVESSWDLDDNWGLHDHWRKKRDHLDEANTGSRNKIYLTTLNGANGSFPYFVASGHSSNGTSASRLATGRATSPWDNNNDVYPDFPRVDCWEGFCTIAFEGVNTLVKDYINNQGLSHAGIVVADFPGKGLINAIINRNFRLNMSLKNKVLNKFVRVFDNNDIRASGSNSYNGSTYTAKLEMKILHNGVITLKSNGNWIGVSPDGSVTSMWSASLPLLPNFLFSVVENDDGTISLKSATNNKYIVANSATDKYLKATQSYIDNGSKFSIKMR